MAYHGLFKAPVVMPRRNTMDQLTARKRQRSDHSEDTSSSDSASSSDAEELEDASEQARHDDGALDKGGIPEVWDNRKNRFFSFMNREVTARDASGSDLTRQMCFVQLQELFVVPAIERSMPGLLRQNKSPLVSDALVISLKQPLADEEYQPEIEILWLFNKFTIFFQRIAVSNVVKQFISAAVPPCNTEHTRINFEMSWEDASIRFHDIKGDGDLHLLAPSFSMVISICFRDAWLQHLISKEYGWEARYKRGERLQCMEVQLFVPSATVDMLVKSPHNDRHGYVILFPKFDRDYPIDQSEQCLALLTECGDKGFVLIEPYDTHSDAARVVDTLKVLLL